MNNKGFAISTMLYGLSIVGLLIAVSLLQTISTTRSEEKQLVTSIEDDLNTFSATSKAFGGSGKTMAKYQIPNYETGWYKIELWGSKNNSGVAGNYSTATLYIKKNSPIYIYLGTKTSASTVPTYLCMKVNKNDCTSKAAGTYVMDSNTKFGGVSSTNLPNSNLFNEASKTYRTETIYTLTKVNNDEYGKARITLVSKKYNSTTDSKRYVPIKDPSTTSGTYYIIDRTIGKALTYKENSFPQVTYENFDGNGNQKWIYNKTYQSLTSNRKHCVLRYGDANKLFCDGPYRKDDQKNKFIISASVTDSSTVNSTIGTNNTNQKTLFSIRSASYYLSISGTDGIVSTTGKNFYVLNAN